MLRTSLSWATLSLAARPLPMRPSRLLACVPAAPMSSSIASALGNVRQKLAEAAYAAKRPAPRLVAVSKTKPVELLREAYDAGVRDFGENYVQELVSKAPEMPDDVAWRFIGSLQSNKAKTLVQGVP